ncbi:MAG: thioredoxin domain-containing protein, partial [candidate division Zixibacteria bacterium]|nr:thioredoxin domain-containing protein [candidate division Zixibacteria bacterium]
MSRAQKSDKEKPVQITKGGAGTLEGLAPAGVRQKKDHEIKWMEWSDAAFARAKQEDKLLLLDITAVWCHWCHVMDETSYSDSEVIRFLNERFIPVRVEADQRPDVQNR